MHYPLLCKLIVEEFPEPFKHHFVFKILPNITPEELNTWIECSKQKIPMIGYDTMSLEYNTESNTTTNNTIYEHLFQYWYNKNLENISFGSEFTPAEIVIPPTTFKDRIRWLLGDIQLFFIKLKRKIFN